MKLAIRIFIVVALVLVLGISSVSAALADVEASCEICDDYIPDHLEGYHDSYSYDRNHIIIVYGELWQDEEMVDSDYAEITGSQVGVTTYADYDSESSYWAGTWSEAYDWQGPWYDFAEDDYP